MRPIIDNWGRSGQDAARKAYHDAQATEAGWSWWYGREKPMSRIEVAAERMALRITAEINEEGLPPGAAWTPFGDKHFWYDVAVIWLQRVATAEEYGCDIPFEVDREHRRRLRGLSGGTRT
jgi:hypothetical protein